MSLVYLELSSGFSFYLEWKPTSLLSSVHKTLHGLDPFYVFEIFFIFYFFVFVISSLFVWL